jgi:nucleoside 2-deoxyribosyltransferase
MKKCYIASGWFSPEWLAELENIKTTLDNLGLDYFSPKDENLCDPDSSVDFQDQVFAGNIRGMAECDWMVCNTRNKDMGTIFEAGYFHSLGKPIVYFCAGLPEGAKFNLMLAASGVSVCTSIGHLDDYLSACININDRNLKEVRYGGKIE